MPEICGLSMSKRQKSLLSLKTVRYEFLGFGLVWFGLAWLGLAWIGLVWFDLV